MALGVGGAVEPLPDPPVNTALPTIFAQGPEEVGIDVSLSEEGTWSGVVESRTYQWLKDEVELPGETNTTVPSGLWGEGLYALRETAHNAGGSASAVSAGIFMGNPV